MFKFGKQKHNTVLNRKEHKNSNVCSLQASRSGGFTLIELILVVALIAISVGVTSDILISLVRSYNKSQVSNEIEQQANFLSSKIEKELKNAISVSGNQDTNTITLIDKNNATIIYSVDTTSGVVNYSNTSHATTSNQPLTSNTAIGGVRITCIGVANTCFHLEAGTPTVLTYSMRFSQAQASPLASFTGSVDIINTVVIRRTYQ